MPALHDVTTLAYVFHIGGGTVGLFSGTIAIFAEKGGRLHRTAGIVFFVSMLVMATFAAYLGVVMPRQFVNVLVAAFASYLIVTAWLTVRRHEGTVGTAETIAMTVAVVLCAPFVVLSGQLALGFAPFLPSAIPIRGPVLIAVYAFTTVLLIALAGDARVVFAHGISGAPRIARHLWRMCLGLTLAAGSAFTNGLPRLLPGPMHVTPIFFLPQLVPLVLLVFWMIRVRFTDWHKSTAAPAV